MQPPIPSKKIGNCDTFIPRNREKFIFLNFTVQIIDNVNGKLFSLFAVILIVLP